MESWSKTVKLMRIPIPVPLIPTALLLILLSGSRGAAEEYTEDFDSTIPTSRIRFGNLPLKLISHQRHTLSHSGRAAERVVVQAAQAGQFQLEYNLPKAVTLDELKLSLWVRSNNNGGVLFLRVVFPHQKDPRTKKTLTTFLRGDQYTSASGWQQLTCSAHSKQIRHQLVQLRAQLNQPILDTRDIYVDKMMLTIPVQPGTSELFVDELLFGPIITPQSQVTLSAVGTENKSSFPVEFILDRLQVNGRPFFPRFAAFHNEGIDALKETGLNLIWVPNHQDQSLLTGLRRRGLWVTATPPRPGDRPNGIQRTSATDLVPFSEESAPIMSWMIGTGIPPEAREEFAATAQQIRNADRSFKRPLMADFTGLEHVYSRHNLMMGVSRDMLNSSFTFQQYRDWLIQKHELAHPGTFLWSWIQTEPDPIHAAQRRAAGLTPVVIEPEQLRMQVYALLSAGGRGIGYKKHTPLDADSEGTTERRLAITQLNMELELLEPWLATGTVISQVPFSAQNRATTSKKSGRGRLDFYNTREEVEAATTIHQEQLYQKQQSNRIGSELSAAILKSDKGHLLLPAWFESQAQFVPGRMAAKNVTIIVPPVMDESASVWEITTTRIISRTSNKKRVTGGIQITLPLLDQTSAILFTTDPKVVEALRKKVQTMAMKSARVSIDLAVAKLARVRRVDAEIRKVHSGQPDAPQLLSSTQYRIDLAEDEFKRGDYHWARKHAAEAMQHLRVLQRAHWNSAVSRLSSPASSLHTVSFQTLPDYWRMVASLGRSPVKLNGNLIRSGDFEDHQTMVAERWGHTQNKIKGIRAAAELYPGGKEGSYALRLIAVPETGQDEPPAVIPQNPVTVTTPAVLVHSGQIIHTSGWIRVMSPIVGSIDGAVIHDNLGGPIGALRWRDREEWERFEIIREVRKSGPYQVTIALNGMGEIHIDELKIVPHSPRAEIAKANDTPSEDDRGAGARALEFFNRLPKFNPKLNPFAEKQPRPPTDKGG